MGFSNNLLRLSKERLVIAGQSIVILFLGFWIIEEYENNIFLQDYVSNVWSADWWIAPSAAVALLIVGGFMYLAGVGRARIDVKSEVKNGKMSGKVSQQEVVTSGGVVVMDVCPFCNVPLRVVGEDRYHCRKCRRYFKR